MACSASTVRLCCSGPPDRTPSAPSQLERVYGRGFSVPRTTIATANHPPDERKAAPVWSCCIAVHAAGPPRWPAHPPSAPSRPAGHFAVLPPALLLKRCLGHSSLLGSLSASCWGSIHPVLIPFAVIFRPLVSRLVERSPATDALLKHRPILVVGRWRWWPSLRGATYQGNNPEPAIRRTKNPRVSWLDLGLISALLLTALPIWPSPARPDPCSPSMNRSPSRVGWPFRSSSCCSFFCWGPGGGDLDQGRGVLLIVAFVVIPACASRLVRQPLQFLTVWLASGPRGPLRVLGPC